MKIKSYVGGHDIKVFKDCVYDPSTRKFTGGTLLTVIPYSGKMLSALVRQIDTEPIEINEEKVPVRSPQIFADVDPLPDEDECDYCIVSSMYVAACKALGIDTSRLLTVGSPVADEEGRVIGCINLNKN